MSSYISRRCLLASHHVLRLVSSCSSEQLALRYPLWLTAPTCYHNLSSISQAGTKYNRVSSRSYHVSVNHSFAQHLLMRSQSIIVGNAVGEQTHADNGLTQDSMAMGHAQNSPNIVEGHKISSTKILASLFAEELKRLKVLRLEYDVFYSTGIRVPDHVSDDDWLHLLRSCPTLHARKRYYLYLFKKEKAKLNEKVKHALNVQLRKEKFQRRLEEIQAEGPDALPFKNSVFMHIREATMNRHYYNNLCHAMINGPHLVFDFGYEDQMTHHELTNLFDQVAVCHGINKTHRQPFHFHFCNVRPGSKTATRLQMTIGDISTIPISVTSQHYLDCYEYDRLVYLSPNAPTVMNNSFDVDDVFIIGAIVDKATEEPMTLAKAKQQKIRTVRFPLDNHIRWVQGSKSLALNHVVKILHDFKESNDWKSALLANLPSRKFTKY